MGVVHEVRDHALESAAVDLHERIAHVARELDLGLVEAVAARRRAHRLVEQLDGGDGLHGERNGPGVATGHLEQVLDERLEDREVGEQQVEALLTGRREVLAVLLED